MNHDPSNPIGRVKKVTQEADGSLEVTFVLSQADQVVMDKGVLTALRESMNFQYGDEDTLLYLILKDRSARIHE